MPRRPIRTTLLTLLALGIAFPAKSATEGELRAAMIFNIVRFVQWPKPALSGSSFNVCSVGSDAVSDGLGQLASKPVHDLPVSVHFVKRDGDLSGCHVVYIGAEQEPHLAAIAEQLHASRTTALTVGDAPSFMIGGGMVQLLTLEGRQRFRINQRAAEKAGLTINAKLLQLALPPGEQ